MHCGCSRASLPRRSLLVSRGVPVPVCCGVPLPAASLPLPFLSGAPASNKPHLAEKRTPVWLAIWRTWAGFANSQLLPDAAAAAPCRVPRGAATFPHRLPLRSIPPAALRLRAPPIHEGHGRPRSVRKSSRLRGKCLFTELLLLRHSKSFGPSAPIAYATSVSPPDGAVAWPGTQVLDAR